MQRPISVTILSWILIAAGAVGLVYHITEFRTLHPVEFLAIELIRVVAVVAGVYMLRGANWARWLAVAWIALHVGISYFHSWGEMAMHAVILVVFAIALFTRRAGEYFRAGRVGVSESDSSSG
jgi:hypothetical protein